MSMTDKMVSENKGKEGKSPRLDDLGYKRNCTHECGNNHNNNNNKEGEQHWNQGKKYEGNLNNDLKLKEERKEKERDIWEKRESR